MTDEFKNLVVVAAIVAAAWWLWKHKGGGACCSACAQGGAKQPGGQSHPKSNDLQPTKKQPCGCGPYAASGR